MLSKSKTLSDDNPFSLSLGDLMAGLLLIFVLLLSFVMLRLENLMEEKRRELELLDDRERIKKLLISRLLKELSEFDVEVDPDTGVIRIKEGEFCSISGELNLSQEGKDVPSSIYSRICGNSTLRSASKGAHIAQVIIEGHTDNVGELRV